jgi:hypothetical protein
MVTETGVGSVTCGLAGVGHPQVNEVKSEQAQERWRNLASVRLCNMTQTDLLIADPTGDRSDTKA